MARSQWASQDIMSHVLAALTPENRLAITVSLLTGLRIGDVLSLRTRQLYSERFTVVEEKTLKKRTVRLPNKLREQLISYAGKIYVFPNRLDPCRHRTRQAVYKDIKRAAKAFRVRLNITPHSARKCYAVAEYRRDFNAARVQRLLNHSSEAVTMIYALADQITARNSRKNGRGPGPVKGNASGVE